MAVAYKDASVTTTPASNTGTDIIVSPSTPLPVRDFGTGGTAIFSTPIAPSDSIANAAMTGPPVLAALMGFNVGGTWTRTYNQSHGDGASATTIALHTIAEAYGYVGGGLADRLRTPTTFKTVTATASGDTAVWTPTSGKKFRLMGAMVELSGNAQLASAATFNIVLRDATTAIGVGFSASVGAAAITTSVPNLLDNGVNLGNGILSAAANNVLNVNLSAALTGGVVRVTAWGTEE